MGWRRFLPNEHWIEPILALILVGGMIRTIIFLMGNGYLPQPYFYDPADTWMDWFNTGDWARDRGVYDSWGSVYAPLTLVFLRIFGLSQCYLGGGQDTSYYARACDWLGVFWLHAFYVIAIVVVAVTYLKTNRRTALPRAMALMIGLPMTSGLERGNIILIAFLCVALAFGPLFKSARMRWLALGLAINFKLYIIAALFPQLLRRRWRWFEGASIATIAVYLLTYGILGRGAPGEIIQNIIGFRDVVQANQFLDVLYAATYAPFYTLLNNQSFPITSLIGSKNVDILLMIIPVMLRTTQIAIIFASIAAWVRPEVVPMYRLTNLGLCLALITAESGGYSLIFVIFFTFFEEWKGFGRKIAIVSCYLVCIQFDFIIDRAPPVVRETYFFNSATIVNYYIMLGSFVRPAIFYLIPFALSIVTLGEVWRDVRAQGWKTRWRYRHDFPIMVGAGVARLPA